MNISSKDKITSAIGALESGKVLLMLCDTIFGLVAKAPDTFATLQKIKGRQDNKPFLQLFADLEQLRQSPWQLPPVALQKFWPGPLTCVLAAKESLQAKYQIDSPPDTTNFSGAQKSQAVRIPKHSLLQELCRATQAPLYSSSANRSGQTVPPTESALLREFAPEILDGIIIPYFFRSPEQQRQKARASTIVDARGQVPRILRQGDLIL